MQYLAWLVARDATVAHYNSFDASTLQQLCNTQLKATNCNMQQSACQSNCQVSSISLTFNLQKVTKVKTESYSWDVIWSTTQLNLPSSNAWHATKANVTQITLPI